MKETMVSIPKVFTAEDMANFLQNENPGTYAVFREKTRKMLDILRNNLQIEYNIINSEEMRKEREMLSESLNVGLKMI
jgi:hypothetical protein